VQALFKETLQSLTSKYYCSSLKLLTKGRQASTNIKMNLLLVVVGKGLEEVAQERNFVDVFVATDCSAALSENNYFGSDEAQDLGFAAAD